MRPVQSLGHVAEGVYSARTVWQRARRLGVDMPVTECVVALLDGALKPVEAVAALMERDPRASCCSFGGLLPATTLAGFRLRIQWPHAAGPSH